ncbi:hypothetical protein ACLIKE_05205 [Ferroplasma acidiphilum]|uniref:Uncharacterized protein n=1 Tax=Ferroplasma acidiphilum TaxID=74969 RepID=A0A7K4FMJ0_9ARCH|nr:hypothetical protein [Ferroplasma acidiphilum]NOL60233.1 hypothetical protein [Ferroplasma acidiphilum]
MDRKDVNLKMDMKMKLVISGNADIFRWLKLHNITMSIFIKEDSQNSGDYYFEAFIAKDQEIAGFKELIDAYGAIESEHFFLVVRPLVNQKILNFIKELWTVPSISFSETTVENGKLILRIIFHSNYKKDLSLILNRYLVIPYFIDDIILTKNEGFTYLLEKKNKRVPLSIIQYSLPLSIHDGDDISRILEENNGIAEVVESPYDRDNFKLHLFLENPVEENDKIRVISREDKIYEAYSTNKLLSTIRNKANERGIFRNQLFIKIKDGRIYSSSSVNTYRAMEYLKLTFASSMGLYGKNFIRLENCTDFDPSLHDSL